MDSSDENDMGEVDITLADRYFDRLTTLIIVFSASKYSNWHASVESVEVVRP